MISIDINDFKGANKQKYLQQIQISEFKQLLLLKYISFPQSLLCDGVC